MPYVLIIHTVADYAAWKRIFDEAAEMRKHAGEICYRLLCDEQNPLCVIHFSQWQSLQQARAFFESDELVKIRQRAGVHAPSFLYLNHVEEGVL